MSVQKIVIACNPRVHFFLVQKFCLYIPSMRLLLSLLLYLFSSGKRKKFLLFGLDSLSHLILKYLSRLWKREPFMAAQYLARYTVAIIAVVIVPLIYARIILAKENRGGNSRRDIWKRMRKIGENALAFDWRRSIFSYANLYWRIKIVNS